MRITTEQTKNGKIRVFADGEYSFTVSGDFWYSFSIYDDDEISPERLSEIQRMALVNRCIGKAYSLLARRAHSERELRRKLSGSFDEDAVDQAIAQAKELSFLDDTRYAADLAEELLRLKHYAPSRIRAELLKRGVSRDDADSALATLDFDAQRELLFLLTEKLVWDPSDEKDRKRVFLSLQRLGYSYYDIQDAMNDFPRKEEDE